MHVADAPPNYFAMVLEHNGKAIMMSSEKGQPSDVETLKRCLKHRTTIQATPGDHLVLYSNNVCPTHPNVEGYEGEWGHLYHTTWVGS